jgi:nucleotide-binding universal stress UspA family protein
MFRTILVPTDLSDCSKKALVAAVDLASMYGGTLHILNVMQRPESGRYNSGETTDAEVSDIEMTEGILLDEALEAARTMVAAGKPELSRERIFLRITSGSPDREILKTAEEIGPDLIVMGTHGRTTIQDMFLGSTAERVAREAGSAVLVVKPDGYPYLRD